MKFVVKEGKAIGGKLASRIRFIELIKGDITTQDCNAIVNAAHEGMCGGGGVDGAIHKAAGAKLAGECMNLFRIGGRCNTGEARITQAYELPCYYVIHTVGPVWRGGQYDEQKQLLACYINSLMLADAQGLRSIAFPCIATGAYCFPQAHAANIAICAAISFLEESKHVNEIRFVCHKQSDYDIYADLLPAMGLGLLDEPSTEQ